MWCCIYSVTNEIFITDIVGLAVWVAGFLIEIMADKQLSDHLANPAPGTGKFIKSGLWRYSRHPNYFGEAVMWWGLWIIACGLGQGWWITLYASFSMTLALRFVTGCPFIEKKYKDHPEWQEYCKETNCMMIWFVKKNDSDFSKVE